MNVPKCVVLAAGSSTRLRPLTDSKPKCLLEVGGKALLERTIENVLAVGIEEIAIVVGYRAEMIRAFMKLQFPLQKIHFILNPNYASTNNAYSLFLARQFMEDGNEKVNDTLLLLDSDILFSSNLLPYLLSAKGKNKIAVRVSGEHNEEEIRVKVNGNGNIILIGKKTPLAETYGESIGVEIFSTRAADKLFMILDQRVRNGEGRNEFYEMTFQKMIEEGITLKAVDVSPFPAIEIDTLEDLRLAERLKVDE